LNGARVAEPPDPGKPEPPDPRKPEPPDPGKLRSMASELRVLHDRLLAEKQGGKAYGIWCRICRLELQALDIEESWWR